ncbi:MAG: DeoR family transcriptional regulator, partial [Acetivibrio ethanolgignens]
MLMEQRFYEILRAIEEKQTVTVQELTELLNTSESTIRRDLSILDKEGKLNKVHGGATAIGHYTTKDEDVALRMTQNREEKLEIVRYAATLILPEDFVYLDAGTTTELMID